VRECGLALPSLPRPPFALNFGCVSPATGLLDASFDPSLIYISTNSHRERRQFVG
jgi:hypothetical protein